MIPGALRRDSICFKFGKPIPLPDHGILVVEASHFRNIEYFGRGSDQAE
jgi:hypothetical protein